MQINGFSALAPTGGVSRIAHSIKTEPSGVPATPATAKANGAADLLVKIHALIEQDRESGVINKGQADMLKSLFTAGSMEAIGAGDAGFSEDMEISAAGDENAAADSTASVDESNSADQAVDEAYADDSSAEDDSMAFIDDFMKRLSGRLGQASPYGALGQGLMSSFGSILFDMKA